MESSSYNGRFFFKILSQTKWAYLLIDIDIKRNNVKLDCHRRRRRHHRDVIMLIVIVETKHLNFFIYLYSFTLCPSHRAVSISAAFDLCFILMLMLNTLKDSLHLNSNVLCCSFVRRCRRPHRFFLLPEKVIIFRVKIPLTFPFVILTKNSTTQHTNIHTQMGPTEQERRAPKPKWLSMRIYRYFVFSHSLFLCVNLAHSYAAVINVFGFERKNYIENEKLVKIYTQIDGTTTRVREEEVEKNSTARPLRFEYFSC